MKNLNIKSAWDYFSSLSTTRKLLAITVIGFVLRLYVVLSAVAISVDGVEYLRLAAEFSSGDFQSVLDIKRPPLYPILTGLTTYVFNDLELSGRIVSLVFGTLLIPMSFYLGRRIYDAKAGLLAAFFVMVHPYMLRYSAEVLTEGLYCFLVTGAVLLWFAAIFDRKNRPLYLIGIVSVAAYLTKPGGIFLLIIFTVWILTHEIGAIRVDWGRRVLVIASGWAVFIALAMPYLLFLHKTTGVVTVTGKLSLSALMNLDNAFGNGGNLVMFMKNIPEAFTIPFFGLFVWGIIRRKIDGFRAEESCLLVILLSYWILYLFVLPSRRYFVQLMPLALVFSAVGFRCLEQWIRSRTGTRVSAVAVSAALIALIAVVQLPRGMITLHSSRLLERDAGRWLAVNNGSGATVMTNKQIFTYYASGEFVELPKKELKKVVRIARDMDVEYLAGYKKRLRKSIPDFDASPWRKHLIEVKSFDGANGEIFTIYRFSPRRKG